jgi:DeoR family transcriptional regulator of aga operon
MEPELTGPHADHEEKAESMNSTGNGTVKSSGLRPSPDGDAMLIEERRQHIVQLAYNEGRVRVRELSKALGISQITIRKDLDYLQSKGLLQRSHGGAIPAQPGALFDPSLQEKEKSHHFEKERIAAAAAQMVEEGECVMLDSGTTTTCVAHALKKFSRLTVITNAVNIAAELTGTDFEVLLTGGIVRKNSFSVVGPLAEDMLAEMHADILFLGVDGFDLEVGLTTPNLLESRVNRAMVHAAKRVVAVCDSTKFDRRSLSRIVPVSEVSDVITDPGLPKSVREALESMDIQVTIV